MAAMVLICVMIMPIVYFLGLSAYSSELIASLGFGFGAAVTLMLLFVPKMTRMHRDTDAQKKKSSKIAPGMMDTDMENVSPRNMKKDGPSTSSGGSGSDGGLRNIQDGVELVKGKTRQQRLIICQEQLACWQTFLLEQQHAVMNSSSSDLPAGESTHSAEGPSPLKAYDPPPKQSAKQAFVDDRVEEGYVVIPVAVMAGSEDGKVELFSIETPK
jgi:hypothetical protein